MACLVDPEELVGLIRGGEAREKGREAGEDEAVCGGEGIIGNCVGDRIKIVEVAEQEAQCEAQFAVHVRHLAHHRGAHHHVPCRTTCRTCQMKPFHSK